MSYEPKVMVCNVRGLNDRARRTGVKSVADTTGASIVCLQETKLVVVTHSIVMESLGADFDDYFCLPATDTRGGIIVAWKSRVVQLDSAHVDTNSVTMKVTPLGGAPGWWLTCVYGPQRMLTRSPSLQSYVPLGPPDRAYGPFVGNLT